jgi:hypothetical protein
LAFESAVVGAAPDHETVGVWADCGRLGEYVHFVCAEGYSVSIDMPTALHAQTQMTYCDHRFDDRPKRCG